MNPTKVHEITVQSISQRTRSIYFVTASSYGPVLFCLPANMQKSETSAIDLEALFFAAECFACLTLLLHWLIMDLLPLKPFEILAADCFLWLFPWASGVGGDRMWEESG